MKKRYVPKTGIIATLGPASGTETVLRKMVLAGMDIVRINFSHGTYSDYESWIQTVRKINKKYRRRIRIMGDLEGSRIRIGRFKRKQFVLLEKNKIVYLIKAEQGDGKYIPFDYTGRLSDVKEAEYIYIDDGNIVLKIKSVDKEKIKAVVLAGGILKPRKGVNIPGAKLKFSAITEKDERDIEFIAKHELDYAAQSFVRNRKDVLTLKNRFDKAHLSIPVIAKIENRAGIKHIDSIIREADGIMIARGDMGVSIPIYQVPIVQKTIIKKCKNISL